MMLKKMSGRKAATLLFVCALLLPPGVAPGASAQKAEKGGGAGETVYYPPRGDAWERRRPEEVGMDAALLAEAVAYARAQETRVPRDFSTQVETFGSLLG